MSALIKEIELRKDFFEEADMSSPDPPPTGGGTNFAPLSLRRGAGGEVNTIYFGGGTPSLLTQQELFAILNQIAKHFTINPKAEITLEANPDDINPSKLKEWKQASINRLSIGIQSFNESHLRYMNRAHNSLQGISSVIQSQEAGFNNITIDLIYGFPELSDEQWMQNIETAVKLDVAHISAYCMTVENKTALNSFIKTGKEKPMNEEQAARQFELLVNTLSKNGFVQYEISNFCKNDAFSKHNSNYWIGEKYLGLGPSAHSYDGIKRYWNISNNGLYIKNLENNQLPFEYEILTPAQRYNEYVLTTLRTIWGCDLSFVERESGGKFLSYCLIESKKYEQTGDLIKKNNHLYLTEKGKLIADKIASDLFWVD